MGAGIPSLPPPIFVNDVDGLDPNNILADMIAEFESASGRILQPAQVERLLINLYAYRESLVRNAIQFAAEQNLLAFASFPMIDYLGQLLSVSRLASQPAVTTIQFTLTDHGERRGDGDCSRSRRKWLLAGTGERAVESERVNRERYQHRDDRWWIGS